MSTNVGLLYERESVSLCSNGNAEKDVIYLPLIVELLGVGPCANAVGAGLSINYIIKCLVNDQAFKWS